MQQLRCPTAAQPCALLRVLVVDDSKVMRNLIAASVEPAGGVVVGQAADGEEGLELFKSLRPDLVLLDVTMPNRDGRECLRDILKTDPNSNVAMLSAISAPEVVSECKSLGARHYIDKDIIGDRTKFEQLLRSIIDSIRNPQSVKAAS